MTALDGCAQSSGWWFIFTGDTGECPNLDPAGTETGESSFGMLMRTFWGRDGLEDAGFLETWCCEESAAAMAKGIRVSRLRDAGFDQSPDLRRSQLVSTKDESSEDVARLAQCYCDTCESSLCCCIGPCYSTPTISLQADRRSVREVKSTTTCSSAFRRSDTECS